MKPKRPKPKAAPALAQARPLSPGRQWLFRLVAMLLPVLALGLGELALRLAGYGYTTDFYQTVNQGGTRYVISNDTFSRRFFPPELARWPTTFRFPAEKPARTIRVFILGESAAMGDPQPTFGAGRYLEKLLTRRHPDYRFEIVNLGITAINSHVILPIARETARQQGDVWIVYMGNNEMVGPFGAATVFGAQAAPRLTVKLTLALQEFRLGQWLMSLARKSAGKVENPSWEGMQMFMKNLVPAADARRETVYANFAANLRDILRLGVDSGAKVILNTMSVNLRDCPPFASAGDSNRPAAERAQFERLMAEGMAWARTNNPAEAARCFEQAAQFDPTFAEARYRWAEAMVLRDAAGARTNYQAACDTDALPFRADGRINAVLRAAADEFGNRLMLCDAEAALAQASPTGIAGPEVFFEHVHFSFHGNYLLARLWAEHVSRAVPELIAAKPAGDWATEEECDRDLGLTDWNRGFVLNSVVRRMQQPPLSSQFNNAARVAVLQRELDDLRARQRDTNAIMQTGQALVDAMQRAPNDPFLQEGFGNFLEAVGDRKQAATAYGKMLELLPHDFYSRLQLGRLLGELGRPAEGEPLLQAAARQRPTVPDLWAELGDLQMAQQKFAAALASYTRGLELRPQDAVYRCYQANALAKLNRRAEAIAGYRAALERRADLAEAHFELGGLLVAEGQLPEALKEYAESVRLNPRHAIGRIHYGVVLYRQNRLDEATEQFQAALQLDPRNATAAEYLRQASARRQPRPL